MKIKRHHYNILEQAIRETRRKHYSAYSQYRAEGLSDQRYRWDMLAISKTEDNQPLSQFLCSTLYTYLNDTHIDTALRKITETNK